MYVTDVNNTSPLIQLLEQIAKQQYEIKALADNQVKVQPKTSESYRTMIKVLAEKRTEFGTYKLKEERSYRVVLKNKHYSISPREIKKMKLRNNGTCIQISRILNNTELCYHSPCFL
jgi:hypothetical protein